MSNETMQWLNDNTLIGFTDKYGRAWHYDESLQGDEPNHYPMAVPVEDVQRRLFNWEAVAVPGTYAVNGTTYSLPGKVVARSDTGAHLGTFSDGYETHQYSEWLLDKVGTLLSEAKSELGIGSAVLLQGGAVAAVQVEPPESVIVGTDEIRPFILATTSHNGKFATTYKRGTTRVVCDNTLSEFHLMADAEYKVKHTKNSKARISEAREALEITFKHWDAEKNEIESLMNQSFTDVEFEKLVKMIDPVKDNSDRGNSRQANRQMAYMTLWNHDKRIGDYKNTAWGALQVFNTYRQHSATTWGKSIRPEVNMLHFLSDKTAKDDGAVLKGIKAIVNDQITVAI